ncbi:hypothetical protein [Embleya sp. NPDC020630]|uniref:hypothetical protein n=1 Tax=Embleya sp. NPDC020630 TaxID=3363979 RepID=UPI00378FBE61
MDESWRFADGLGPVAAESAVEALRRAIADGRLESWLTSSSGRLLAVVSNADRAMVMLLDGVDDPGEHAADPGAEGCGSGFVLANGQSDEYANADTVPLAEAFRIVRHIVSVGIPPADVPWVIDR